MKKMLFVYNPNSGKGAIKGSLSDILCVFTENGYDVTVHPTSARNDGEEYITANAEKYDIIVSNGGDGMIHELVRGMLKNGAKKPCGYIPSGSVNDFASSLKIPKKLTDAASVIVKENFTDIDIGSFNGEYFSYVAAFGMFTNVSYETDQKVKNLLGAGAYVIEILRSMDLKSFQKNTSHITVSFNGESVEDDFIFGMVGNTYSVGGLTALVPSGVSLDDGLLDGMFIKSPKTIAELEMLKMALINPQYNSENIITAKSECFEITSEKEVAWTLDGEFGGNITNAKIGITPKALKIAVPD
ncbi:MAG: YegS/Rv2252/BmrU family lipid kinase [Eubacterium sp.]|nr:YegS/Rv2252/BmrU family lipid kinase [Eubacterium sp.]